MLLTHAQQPSRLRGRRTAALLIATAVALALAAWNAPAATAVPSAVVHYAPSLPSSLEQYAQPGNVFVVTAEQRNRNPARIRAWRAKGAIVLAYVNLVDYIRPADPIQNNLYGGAFPEAWFYPGNYSNYGGLRLLDLRASSRVATYNGFTGTWGQYAARWIRNEVIKDGSLFNGIFLDVWGARLWNVPAISSGPGSDWEAGIARWGQEIRDQVGPNIFLVGNNHQTRTTAVPLNGKMWESFDGNSSGYNQLTGRGESEGLIYTFAYPEWRRPQLDILWKNEASPSQATKDMLVASANRVTRTGTDIVVGSSNHQGGFPAPFGGGGGSAPPGSSVPSTVPGAPAVPAPRGPAAPPSAGPGAAGRDALLRSEFSRAGVVHPWQRITGTGSRVRGTRQGIVFVAGRRAKTFAAMTTEVAPQRRARVAVRLRVPKLTLRRGGARALLALGSGDGFERQVGILRARRGLVWAAWTRTPTGARTRVVVSSERVSLGAWVTLRLATNWARPQARDTVRIGTAIALRARAGRLSGRHVQRVSVGLGRASSAGDRGALVVRRVSVAGAPS